MSPAAPLPQVTIYTDGSCLGNPGAGGWAAVLEANGKTKNISGGEPHTTNNRMEMTAVIRALAALKTQCAVRLHTDSQYVANGITQWLPAWQRKNYRKADGKPVKNSELWQQLDAAQKRHTIEWIWVRGHASCAGNNRADELAHAAAVQASQQHAAETATEISAI